VLEGFARIALDRGQPGRALTLAGAAASLRRTTGGVGRWEQERQLEGIRAVASGCCGAGVADAHWQFGAKLPFDQAVAYALTTAEVPTALR
jgi:hypothetical protein